MPNTPNPQKQENSQKEPVNEKTEEQIAELEDNLDLSPDELSETVRNEPSTKNHVTSFAIKPKNASFDAQLKKEEIVLLLRRHPVTQLSKITLIAFGILFPLLLIGSPLLEFMKTSYKIATIFGWYLVLSGFALESFLTWYFRVFIITNRRVIDIDYYSMVHKDVTVAELIRIQDMSVVSTGVLASLADFGTLYLQTAGQNFNPARFNNDTDSVRSAGIEFEDIARPIEVKRIVSELIATKRRKYRMAR